MTQKYQPKTPDGKYFHKSKSGTTNLPWNRLTYDVKTPKELDHYDLQKRIKRGRQKTFLENL